MMRRLSPSMASAAAQAIETLELTWVGLVPPAHVDHESVATAIEIQVRAVLCLEPDGATRLHVEREVDGTVTPLIDERVTCQRGTFGAWTSYDVFRNGERVLAISRSAVGHYVSSVLPGLAGFSAGQVDPASLHVI